MVSPLAKDCVVASPLEGSNAASSTIAGRRCSLIFGGVNARNAAGLRLVHERF